MTAHALYLQRTEALIASDTVIYTPRGDPLGFASKVHALPHLRAAMFGRGMDQILVRAAMTIAFSYQYQTIEGVADALPDIFRGLTDDAAEDTGLIDPDSHLLFEGRLIGWSTTERRIRFWTYENYNDNYEKQEPQLALGWKASPAIPAEFHPPSVKGLSIERQAIEIMRAHKRCFNDQAARGLPVPCLGGEVMLTRITERGVDTRAIWNFPDAAEMGHAGAAVAARALRGDYQVDLNDDLGRVENAIGQRRTAPSAGADQSAPQQFSRQQRRAAAAAARKAAKRAA